MLSTLLDAKMAAIPRGKALTTIGVGDGSSNGVGREMDKSGEYSVVLRSPLHLNKLYTQLHDTWRILPVVDPGVDDEVL
jgi:hypothetical protein